MNDAGSKIVLVRQVALLYRNLRLGQIVTLANAVFIAWVAYPSVPGQPLMLWTSLAVAVAFFRLFQDKRFRQLDEPTREREAPTWQRRAILGASLSGIVWAVGAAFLMTAGNPELKLFTAFIMAGMVAGAVQVVAADLVAFRAYAWPIVITVAVCAFDTSRTGAAFSGMSLLFMLIVTRSAQFFNRALHEAIRLEQEQAQLVANLEQARQETERSNRAKTEFLANISHELRTPMNGIIGFAELLAFDANPEQQELLVPLRRSADILLKQIDHLIELAALEAGHIELHPAPFVTDDLLESLLSPYRKAASQKGLELIIVADPALPSILLGDVTQLRQIVGHLADNAIKFTETGRVCLTAGVEHRTANEVWVDFTISDTGPGIAPEILQTLNGLLQQADGSNTRRHGGIGVGLPIVRRLLELMGGTLKIDSQPGQGSCFHAILPFSLPLSE